MGAPDGTAMNKRAQTQKTAARVNASVTIGAEEYAARLGNAPQE
jgi:hypothetical protein